MKTVRILALSFIFFYFTDISHSKNIENKQFALFDYEVIIDKAFRNEIKDLDNTINNIRGYMKKGQDKLEGKIYDISYPFIEEKLEKRFKIDILPVQSYTSNISYNIYDYPKISVKKAQELGNSNYYFKISINITTTTPKSKDAQNSILYKNKTCPKVVVQIDVFERMGIIPVGRAIGEAQVTSPQRVEPKFLIGIVQPLSSDEVSAMDETLFALILKAIDNMLISFDKNI